MEKLLEYLNSLTTREQQLFASHCCTSVGYLRKAISTGQVLGAEICSRIEGASNGVVTRSDLRPNDYGVIWPEIVADGQTTGAAA